MKGPNQMNHYEDPFGQVCQRIMTILTCMVMLLALSVYYCLLSIKRAILAIFFKAWLASIKVHYMLKKAYYEVSFFLCKMWDHLYWRHLSDWLYTFGLKPALTDEDTEHMKASLRAIIENKQYCDDPGVAAAIANARAVLQQIESEQKGQ
jgi:hypothetical protein